MGGSQLAAVQMTTAIIARAPEAFPAWIPVGIALAAAAAAKAGSVLGLRTLVDHYQVGTRCGRA